MSNEALSKPSAPSGVQLRTGPPSRALRAYRRLIPLRLRRAVRARVGVEDWERLRHQLERPALAARSLEQRRLSARLEQEGLLGEGGQVPFRTPAGLRIAMQRQEITPLQAREYNLHAVLGALREAGVDHFMVRGMVETASTVGICTEDRARAEQALHALGGQIPLQLAVARGGQRQQVQSSRPVGAENVWRRVATQSVFRVFCFFADSESAELVLGPKFGCDVEFWSPSEDGTELVAPRRNLTCERISRGKPGVQRPGRHFTRMASADTRPQPAEVPTRQEFAEPLPDDVDFPVDVVYTWVDGSDPQWQLRRAAAVDEPYHPEAANAARYLSHDELRYSLRSLHLYAPWIRNIFIVTDRQVPSWLNTEHPQVHVVDHREIFTDPAALPTFNSHAIESQLHHIEGLAEHFLYFNDDVFLGRPALPQDFFLANGLSRFFPSKALLPPVGSTGTDDVPVSAAGVTNRQLLAARFGRSITRKMKHTPCALRRSVLEDVERVFADAHQRTAGHAFRSPDDIAITNSLHHYYAFHTGRAVPGTIRYDYVDISQPRIESRLRRLLNRSYLVFCLNDTTTCDGEEHVSAGVVQQFLDSYYPTASPYECPHDPTAAAAPAGSAPSVPRAVGRSAARAADSARSTS
ncbi:stealth family protein [Streptomyces endophyticus]|uniref:Stealth family protein n=1 Tax=Streptomyces endophyticus TaxID=714166 RepID=A0ABU6F6A2_9ACTN|nr:stealth family protein [Streptomyces endophyticus]MEB8339530.1 stealth family protein [Streptomyces endophyticus]